MTTYRRPSYKQIATAQFLPKLTSNWLCYVEQFGQYAPNPLEFNLIRSESGEGLSKNVIPALDINFSEFELTEDTIEIPPGLTLKVPVGLPQTHNSLTITVVDSFQSPIRRAINSWVLECLSLKAFTSPPISELPKYSLKLVYEEALTGSDTLLNRRSFLILPPEPIQGGGDSSFNVDNPSFTFNVIGQVK